MREGAVAKFEATAAKMTKLNDKAKWLQLETSVPQTTPAEQIGSNYTRFVRVYQEAESAVSAQRSA